MTKSMDVLTDAVRNPKHPLRHAANQPDKAHKHRYERRKVKQCLQTGDWSDQEQAE